MGQESRSRCTCHMCPPLAPGAIVLEGPPEAPCSRLLALGRLFVTGCTVPTRELSPGRFLVMMDKGVEGLWTPGSALGGMLLFSPDSTCRLAKKGQRDQP